MVEMNWVVTQLSHLSKMVEILPRVSIHLKVPCWTNNVNLYVNSKDIRPRGYKTFFMLSSGEYEICPVDKSQIANNCKFFLAKHD